MDNIGVFKLPNNHLKVITITGITHNEATCFSASFTDRDVEVSSIEKANWRQLIDFLDKHQFNQYELFHLNNKYFELVNKMRLDTSKARPKKMNSQERILILWKRLSNKEALNLSELTVEFNVCHSQLVRDIAIIRRVFENREIRYDRVENLYKII